MVAEAGCPFCEIVAGDAAARIVSQAQGVTSFFPDEPATQGHTMVVPNDHHADIWSLDQGAARNLASEVLRVSHAIRGALHPDGLNIIQSNGDAAGQSIRHVHVHVLPRWVGDPVGDLWPTSPKWTEDALSTTQKSIMSTLESDRPSGYDLSSQQDREDRRKHLDLLTAAINRMASSSFAAKGWAITLAGAAFGVAIVRESWPLIAIGMLAVLAFGLLDARYLDNERRARDLYNWVVDDNIVVPLSMTGLATSSRKNHWWWPSRFASWSIWYFYSPLLLAGALLLFLAIMEFGGHEAKPSDHPPKPTATVTTPTPTATAPATAITKAPS